MEDLAMSFSQWIVSALVAINILSACSLPVGESPSQSEKQKASLGFESKCLKNTFPVLKGFIDGTAAPEQLSALWNCLGGAVDLFYRKVKTRNQDAYAPEELAQFLEEFFLDNTKISPEFLREAMLLKRVVIGGSEKIITRAELIRISRFIQETKEMTLLLLPHMRVYTMSWDIANSSKNQKDLEKDFADASSDLTKATDRLAVWLTTNNQSYSLRDFNRFLVELRNQFAQDWSFVDKLGQYLPVLEKTKKALIGGNEYDITSEEWRNFMLLGSRGYVQYLRYHYFLRNDKFQKFDEGRLDLLATFVDEALNFAGDLIATKNIKELTTDDIQYVLDEASYAFKWQTNYRELMLQIMNVKKAVFGGSEYKFTPDDFARAHQKLQVVKVLSIQSLPFFEIYNFDFKTKIGESDLALKKVNMAADNLDDVAKKIGNVFENDYDIANLKSLLVEVMPFFSKMSADEVHEKLEKYYPVSIAIKQLLTSSQDSVVKQKSWPSLLGNISQIYSSYIFYHYFVKDQSSWTEGVGLENFNLLLDRGLRSVDQILLDRESFLVSPGGGKNSSIQRSGVISINEFKNLLRVLQNSGIISKNLNLSSYESLLEPAFNRFLFDPNLRLRGQRPPNGLNSGSLKVLRNEWSIWLEGQRHITSLFNKIPVPNGFTSAQLIDWINNKAPTTFLREFKGLLLGPKNMPFVFDRRDRLHISSASRSSYDKKSLLKLNLSRQLARWALRSYTQDSNRLRTYAGLSLLEAKTLFSDLETFVVSQGWVSANNKSFVDGRFREANLFTVHADGDDYLGFNEANDLILMIFSGLKLNSDIQVQLRNDCRIMGRSYSSDARVSLRCFINTYRDNMNSTFSSLPYFSRYLRSLPSGVSRRGGAIDPNEMQQFDVMIVNLLKSSGWIDDQSGTVKLSDLGLLPHLFQYVETVVVRFDLNQDGILNREEALEAYPMFKEILKKVAKNDSDKILRGAFAYILVYGHPPETTAEKLKFITVWVNQQDSWPINADRFQLAKVLGYIADALAKPQSSNKDQDFKKYNDGIEHHPENPNT